MDKKEKIIAMFLCILLLSNIGLGYTLASEATTTESGFVFDGYLNSTQEVKNDKVVVTIPMDETDTVPDTFAMTAPETAVYKITLTGVPNGSNVGTQLKYSLQHNGEGYVRLAAEYKQGEFKILTQDTSNDSTIIYVILQENETYTFDLVDTVLSDATLVLEKQNIALSSMSMTNIPATIVSAKVDYDNASRTLESYEPFRLIEYDVDQIREYSRDGLALEKKEKDGGYLEGILADIILALGTFFLRILEFFLNTNVELTIDNILFNRLDQIVIDLAPLGGIQINDTGMGIFQVSNGKVGQVIDILYNGLKSLALGIYIVMLLYVGVRILSEVGGKNQKKYMKYFEYWLSGLILLSILPYFIPALPAINNMLVEMLAKEAESMYSGYSTEDILVRLGYDESLLAEDAEIVQLKSLLQERIDYLNDQLDGVPITRDDAQANIESKKQDTLGELGQLAGDEELTSKVDNVISIVDSNCTQWNDRIQENYEEAVSDVWQYVFENLSSTKSIPNNVLSSLPASAKNSVAIDGQVKSILTFISRNAGEWERFESEYNKRMNTFRIAMENRGYEADYQACVDLIEGAKNTYLNTANSYSMQEIKKMFNDYHDAVIQEEISVLQDMKDNLAKDVMTMLKERAQEDNRVVYAVAWFILMFQMFSVLFLYYRRLITVVILIIIFPIIMAFYVFDKMGDGKSQSLQKWLKEFLANIFVQFLHAAVYIIIVNAGIRICRVDPLNNWFFLILTVCFIFPGERIMRAVLGLESSVLGGLRNNFGVVALGTYAAKQMITNGYVSAKALTKTGQEERKKQKEKERKEEEKREKEKKQMQEKDAKIRAAKRRERNARLAAQEGKLGDKTAKHIDDARLKIEGWKKGKGAKFVVATATASRGVKSAYRMGKKVVKTGAGLARKSVGMTMGAVEGMESFGKEGFSSGLYTARSVARDIGGFKDPKDIKTPQPQITTPNQFSSRYVDGQKVAGSTPVTDGNVPGGSSVRRTAGTGGPGASVDSSGASRPSFNETKTEVRQHIKHVQNNNNNNA